MTLTVSKDNITFPDSTVQTTAAFRQQNTINIFRSSGTWVCPPGVTKVFTVVVGGGGGGGNGNDYYNGCFYEYRTGGTGGFGGVASGYYTVVPGTSYSITVGTGGTGTNTGTGGSAGGSSSFDAFCSATGGGLGGSASFGDGVPGTPGTGSNGNMSNASVSNGVPLLIGANSRTSGSVAPIAWPSTPTTLPGVGGRGEYGSLGNNAAGGIGGVVILQYVSA